MGLWDDMNRILKKVPKGIDISELDGISRSFFRFYPVKTDMKKEVAMAKLLKARVELEKAITIILNYLRKENVQLTDFKGKDEELNRKIASIIYERFSANFAGFMKQLDEHQDVDFVRVREDDLTFPRILAFKGFLETSFFDIIYMPLKIAIDSHNDKKSLEEFYYNWFAGVTCVLSVKGGIRREKIKSTIFRGDQFTPYSDIPKAITPKTKEEEEKEKAEPKSPIDEEWDELFGEDTD